MGKIMKWLSVEEKMPEEDEKFYVVSDGTNVREALLFDGRFCAPKYFKKVTHWMHFPLPNQPEGLNPDKIDPYLKDLQRDVFMMTCKGCFNEILYLDKANKKTVSCKCGTLNMVE